MEEEASSSSNEKCSIDRLPDAVLISIVTLLPFKEAAKTSVLARRWRYFWVFNRVLDFDGSKTVRLLRDMRDELRSERVGFVDWVNRVVRLHSSDLIDEFRLSFDLNSDNKVDIYRWIKFAFQKRVKRLDLNFAETGNRYQFQEAMEFAFPDRIFLPICHLTWESLVSLRLTQVCVNSDCLESFVSNCPFLEELHVENAYGFFRFTTSPQMTRLKRLVIIPSGSFSRLVLCSPSLVSCTCVAGIDFEIHLDDVSSLTSLSLGKMFLADLSERLWEMSKTFSSLETLSFHPRALGDRYRRYPTLPGLRKLVLDVDCHHSGSLLFFTSLFNAAPSLRELVMKLPPLLEQRRGRRPQKGQEHRCLKVFEIQGYAIVEACPEVIIYVLENASSLERLIVNRKVMGGDFIDLLRSKLNRKTCVKDVTDIIFPDKATNPREKSKWLSRTRY